MALLGQDTTPPASKLRHDSVAPGQAQVAAVGAERKPPRPIGSPIAVDKGLRSEVVHHAPPLDENPIQENLPPAIASELKRIDAMRVEVETGTPIERWRFDAVRAAYQALLKTASAEPVVENAIRSRLEYLAQREQAAKAAATIKAILAQSHNRDRDIDELRRQLQTTATKYSRSHPYEAVGFMQPSAQKFDGRKLFVLVGKSGGTVAYLDIPPGLDANPVLARKVGVRGVAHYNEELHSRLITVRDVDAIEPRR